jgi:Flp pilus assembly protein TadG
VRRSDDGGSATIEFVFVAVIVMVPLVYVIAAVATVQRNQLAVTQAARDAGRAFATSNTAGDAQRRVRAAVRLALTDQGLPDDEFTVCVTRRAQLPAVPSVLTGQGIRTTGTYVVHVDDFREVGR